MRYMDEYKHLNKTSKYIVEQNLERVVRKVMDMNYGIHRFLSAFVRFRLQENPKDKLAKGIEGLLEEGLF